MCQKNVLIFAESGQLNLGLVSAFMTLFVLLICNKNGQLNLGLVVYFCASKIV